MLRILHIILLTYSFSSFAAPQDAENFINGLADRVISIVKNQAISDKEKESTLKGVFQESVDTKWIARFAMGRYWRSISQQDQQQYLDLFNQYLTSIYVPNFRKYTGNIVKVTGSAETGEHEYLVHTELTDAQKTMNLKIDYRLMQDKKNSKQFVIFDIIAEGVSLITTQRADISSIMSDSGFSALVTLLKQKTE